MSFSSTVLGLSPTVYGRHGEASGTTLVDSSGNSHGGTYTSVTLGAASLIPSETDTAATYNGTSSRGTITYASWMDSANALSLYVVAKTSTAGAILLLDRDQTIPSSARVWQLRLNGGVLEFLKTNGSAVTVSSPLTYNDGATHHFGATYDGTNVRLYVDGVKVVTTACATLGTAAAPLNIGAHSTPSNWFNGTIDDWFIKNAVLADADFAALYASRPGAAASAAHTSGGTAAGAVGTVATGTAAHTSGGTAAGVAGTVAAATAAHTSGATADGVVVAGLGSGATAAHTSGATATGFVGLVADATGAHAAGATAAVSVGLFGTATGAHTSGGTAAGTVSTGSATVQWFDGTTEQSATILGWWDGTTTQPVTLDGYWDGTAVQPVA